MQLLFNFSFNALHQAVKFQWLSLPNIVVVELGWSQRKSMTLKLASFPVLHSQGILSPKDYTSCNSSAV